MRGKRTLTVVFTLLLIVGVVTPNVVRGLSADGFEYTVSGSEATVTGCTSTCPASLAVPSTLGGLPVTTIGANAFDESAIVTVTIPSSVASIGSFAFYSNPLTAISIPTSVLTIGNWAFANNRLARYDTLESVTIPNSVTSIGNYAFAYNVLPSISIPNSVTTIGGRAFAGNALVTVSLGTSVETVGNWAFEDNALMTVSIPPSVTTIYNGAFHNNALSSVTFLGNAPVSGDDSVFAGNPALTHLNRYSTTTGWDGTWSSVPISVVFPPETFVNWLGSTPSSGAASFTLTSLSAGTFECNLDSAGWSACESSYTTPLLGDGLHDLSVRAVDTAGMADPTPATYSWTTELDLPSTGRDGSPLMIEFAILAGLTSAVGIGLRFRGAKSA